MIFFRLYASTHNGTSNSYLGKPWGKEWDNTWKSDKRETERYLLKGIVVFVDDVAASIHHESQSNLFWSENDLQKSKFSFVSFTHLLLLFSWQNLVGVMVLIWCWWLENKWYLLIIPDTIANNKSILCCLLTFGKN